MHKHTIIALLAIIHMATYGMEHNKKKTIAYYQNFIKLYRAASTTKRLNQHNQTNPAKAIPQILDIKEDSEKITIILPPFFIISKL